MGFANWFAKKGNVGGYARNVAEGWKNIEQQQPGLPPKEIAMIYASVRFRLIDELAFSIVKKQIEVGYVNTPLALAWALLEAENPHDERTLCDHEDSWRKIMREELLKKGLDPSLKFDSNQPGDDKMESPDDDDTKPPPSKKEMIGYAKDVAEGWKRIDRQRPDLSHKEIALTYSRERFGVINKTESWMIEYGIERGEINTPFELAWQLMTVENRLSLPDSTRYDYYRQIMQEELQKKGVDPKLPFDSTKVDEDDD